MFISADRIDIFVLKNGGYSDHFKSKCGLYSTYIYSTILWSSFWILEKNPHVHNIRSSKNFLNHCSTIFALLNFKHLFEVFNFLFWTRTLMLLIIAIAAKSYLAFWTSRVYIGFQFELANLTVWAHLEARGSGSNIEIMDCFVFYSGNSW